MSGENKPSTDQEKLAAALETIKDVLVSRELSSTQSSMKKLESRVSGDLESMRREASEAARKLEERMAKTLADAEKQLDAHGTKSDSRARKLKSDVDKSIATIEEALRHELGTLGQAISALQLELQQQAETTERVSALLGNMATVFSGGPPADAQPPVIAEENVDNALDRMFGDDSGSSEGDPSPN